MGDIQIQSDKYEQKLSIKYYLSIHENINKEFRADKYLPLLANPPWGEQLCLTALSVN